MIKVYGYFASLLAFPGKPETIKIIQVIIYDHGVAGFPFHGILLSFQHITMGMGGIREPHLVIPYSIHQQGFLLIQGIVRSFNFIGDLTDRCA